ncbi:hypothetical protein D3C87_1226610 [compost metagenome]
MVFLTPRLTSSRFHWPMQGPQALAKIFAPMASRLSRRPSRRAVSKIWAEPGLIIKGTAALAPCLRACSATAAAREISS